MESTKPESIPSAFSKHKTFNFYKMKNGSLITCHGRPKYCDIQELYNKSKVNYVLTLLHDGENPEGIKTNCAKVSPSIKWHHLPLAGANMGLLMSKPTSKLILDNLLLLHKEMQSNQLTLFIHCAAGLHRTGIIVYTLLRITGESIQSAMDAIKQIRSETYHKCGDKRIQYAESYLVQPLLSLIEQV